MPGRLLRHDWAGAEAAFRRALAVNPSHATAHQWYGLMLDAVGRHPEGLDAIEHAHDLDPLSLIIRESLGIHYLMVGDYTEATEHLTRALEMSPDFPLGLRFLSEAYLLTDRHEEAAEAVRRRAELIGADPAPLLRALAGVAGDVPAAEAVRALEAAVEAGSVTRFEAAQWAALMGRSGEALEWLEEAYRRRDYLLFLVGTDPALESLRSEPRFREVTEVMGLPEEAAR